MKISETEIARAVVEMLREWGWEVYQEVVGPAGRCDIVGKRGNILWAIECKVNFGFAVLEQAYHWRGYANYVSVAVKSKPSRLGREIAGGMGIGVMSCGCEEIHEVEKPRLMRRIHPLKLYEEQKTFCEAGSSCGGHWTDFKRTVRALVAEVNKNPGIQFDTLVKSLDHHYSSFGSAKLCLRGFIGSVIPDIEARMVENRLCVFPKSNGG
jgi:hypothetical protein